MFAVWDKIIEKYTDQVHLYNTLKNKPDLIDNTKVLISIENSVQLEKVKLLKPELIGMLRKALFNDHIDIDTKLVEKSESESKIFTDEQRIKMMMQKNPALISFKNKFNLDFNA